MFLDLCYMCLVFVIFLCVQAVLHHYSNALYYFPGFCLVFVICSIMCSYMFVYFPSCCYKFLYCLTGVKTQEIRKGRILAGLRDIWRVFLEILPLHKYKKTHTQQRKAKNNLYARIEIVVAF